AGGGEGRAGRPGGRGGRRGFSRAEREQRSRERTAKAVKSGKKTRSDFGVALSDVIGGRFAGAAENLGARATDETRYQRRRPRAAESREKVYAPRPDAA